MAASTQVEVKHFTDGTITLKDGTGTPRELVCAFSVGDYTLSGSKHTMRETIAYQARGVLNTLRKGAAIFATGSFSCQLADYYDATAETVITFLKGAGGSSANVSTSTTKGDVYTLTILISVEGTDLGDSTDHTISLADCDCTFDLAEGQPNSIAINFTVYGAHTYV